MFPLLRTPQEILSSTIVGEDIILPPSNGFCVFR